MRTIPDTAINVTAKAAVANLKPINLKGSTFSRALFVKRNENPKIEENPIPARYPLIFSALITSPCNIITQKLLFVHRWLIFA
jgi:hypothetical protein